MAMMELPVRLVPPDQFPEGRGLALSGSTHFQPLIDTQGVRLVRSLAECLDQPEVMGVSNETAAAWVVSPRP